MLHSPDLIGPSPSLLQGKAAPSLPPAPMGLLQEPLSACGCSRLERGRCPPGKAAWSCQLTGCLLLPVPLRAQLAAAPTVPAPCQQQQTRHVHWSQHPVARWAGAGIDPTKPRGPGPAGLAAAPAADDRVHDGEAAVLCWASPCSASRARLGCSEQQHVIAQACEIKDLAPGSCRRSPGLAVAWRAGSLGQAASARWYGEPGRLSLGSGGVPGRYHQLIKPQHPGDAAALGGW